MNLLLSDDMIKIQINIESDYLKYICHADSSKYLF